MQGSVGSAAALLFDGAPAALLDRVRRSREKKIKRLPVARGNEGDVSARSPAATMTIVVVRGGGGGGRAANAHVKNPHAKLRRSLPCLVLFFRAPRKLRDGPPFLP